VIENHEAIFDELVPHGLSRFLPCLLSSHDYIDDSIDDYHHVCTGHASTSSTELLVDDSQLLVVDHHIFIESWCTHGYLFELFF
jgi:hypothetical protein